MDSKANCLIEMVKQAGGAITERQAAELLRKARQEFSGLPETEIALRGRKAMADVVDNMLDMNKLHDLYAETAEKLKEVYVLEKAPALDFEASRPYRDGVEVTRSEMKRWEEKGEMPKGARPQGYARAMKAEMLRWQDTVKGYENMVSAPLLEASTKYGHLFGDEDAMRKVYAVAFDGAEPESEGVRVVAEALKKTNDLMAANLSQKGVPIARDIPPLYTNRVADIGKLSSLGKEGHRALVEGLNLVKSRIPEKYRDNVGAWADEMYDNMINMEKTAGLDFNGIAYLLDSNKIKNMGARFGVHSNLPFADSASFLNYAAAVSERSIGELTVSRSRQAGKALGLMSELGPTPGKTLDELLKRLKPKMSTADAQFLLGASNGDAALHVSKVDGVWKTIPAVDKNDVPVTFSDAVKDLALSPEKWAAKYGKKQVVDFESETLARQAAAKAKQDLLKGIADIAKTAGLGMPKPTVMVAQLMGDLNAPPSGSIGKATQILTTTLNSLAATSRLGWGVIAQIPDMAYQMNFLASRKGVGSLAEIPILNLKNLIPQWAFGLGEDKITKDIMLRLGQTPEAALENLLDVMGTETVASKGVNLATRLSYAANGMRGLDTAFRRTSHEMYMDAIIDGTRKGRFGEAFAEDLSAVNLTMPELQRVVSEASVQNAAGKWLLDPALISSPDDAAKVYALVQRASNMATAAPTDFDRAILSFGTQAGTVLGAANRMIMSFKSFPVLMYSRILPRVGYDTGVAGKMATIATAAVLWYWADSLRQQALGREPKDLRNQNTLFKMLAMSGGLGLFDLADPSAKSPDRMVANLAGPTISSIASLSMGAKGLLWDVPDGLFSDDSDKVDKGLKNFWRGIKSVTPSLGPIAETPTIGGQSLLDLFFENVMLGAQTSVGLPSQAEKDDQRREAAARERTEFGPPQ